MGIWGKILGGAAGFALGGPLGALVGAAAGHAFDRRRNGAEPELAKQTAFAIAVVVLGAKMAKADGRVTTDEIDAFKEVFHIPPEEAKNVGRLFNQARKDARGFEPYARQAARLFHDHPAVLEELLAGLFHIARADGIAHPDEITYLREVSAIFGLDETTFQRIEASHTGTTRIDPYAILGIPHDAGDDELRAAYRRLIREHHPDRLMAQGMPQDFIDIANEQMAAINVAYDEIRAQRGLK